MAEFPQSLTTRTGETNDADIDITYGRIRKILKRLDIKKLVVYGLPITEVGKGHTHSYIHLGWFRSMLDIAMHSPSRRLEVCWYDKGNKLHEDDVRNALVFTSPAHGAYIAKGLPYSNTSYYVSHGTVKYLPELEKATAAKRCFAYSLSLTHTHSPTHLATHTLTH